MSTLDRLAYTVSQGARFAWFYSQYKRALGAVEPAVRTADAPAGMPSTRRLLAALFEVFARDLANIEAGLYPMPPDMWPRPGAVLRTNRRFFRDLARVDRRRRTGVRDEVLRRRDPAYRAYPHYFLQNFHYQSDGYLSEESAALYDYQVEILFSGGADAMRRQALVPLARWLEGLRQSDVRILDVGCGTGRFLRFLREAQPLPHLAGLDLSLPYLRHARRTLAGCRRTVLVQGSGEALPFPDASLDVVASTYVFHELPPPVRAQFAAEFARVLRPGGLALHVESLQRGDVLDFDPLLDFFPMAYHEPYFASYVDTDLDALFAGAGLAPQAHDAAFLSKTSVYVKPGG